MFVQGLQSIARTLWKQNYLKRLTGYSKMLEYQYESCKLIRTLPSLVQECWRGYLPGRGYPLRHW